MSTGNQISRPVRDPFEVFARDFFGSNAPTFGVDVREDVDHLYLEAELPGFKKEDIDITLEKQVLTITAENKASTEEKKGDYLLRERHQTSVSRSFKLPPTIDEGKVDAKLVDGVLHLTLNKREESKPRKISVN